MVNGLVSVIIPSFNHAGYVRDAVQSVLRQTYPNREVIVVDDGSSDNTREVVGEFGDQVRYIWQENRGLPAARNTGIRAAEGEFIAVLDADDMYEPGFLATLVECLSRHPEAGAAYCGFQFVDAQNSALSQVGRRVVPPEQFNPALMEGNFLVPECMLVRRGCYQTAGLFDESLRACEDWDMWLRISCGYRVIGLDNLLTRHRVLPGSMSTDPNRMLVSRLAVLRKVFGSEDEPPQPRDPARQREYGRAYFATALEFLQYGDPEEGYEYLRKAISYAPALLLELETFYELGCGDQPKGSRGSFATLKLDENARWVISSLDRLFADQQLLPLIRMYRRAAYANAYFALGILGYGAGQDRASREFLLRSLGSQPGYLFHRGLLPTLIRACLGRKTVSLIKSQSANHRF